MSASPSAASTLTSPAHVKLVFQFNATDQLARPKRGQPRKAAPSLSSLPSSSLLSSRQRHRLFIDTRNLRSVQRPAAAVTVTEPPAAPLPWCGLLPAALVLLRQCFLPLSPRAPSRPRLRPALATAADRLCLPQSLLCLSQAAAALPASRQESRANALVGLVLALHSVLCHAATVRTAGGCGPVHRCEHRCHAAPSPARGRDQQSGRAAPRLPLSSSHS